MDATWTAATVGSGIVYLGGVFLLVRFVTIGETHWYERPLAWLWPVTGPLLLAGWALKEIFWG